jgi:anti-sigma B factor antagonist
MSVEMEGSAAVIRLPQFYNGAAVKGIIQLGHEALKAGASSLIVDFTNTNMIDSAGIGSLVALAKDFKATGAKLSLRSLKKEIQELFFDSDLDKIFDIQTEQGLQNASVDIFKNFAEIKLEIKSEIHGDVYVMHLGGVMNHPIGSQFLKQQFLLALAEHKKILIDLEELTFFDSLSVSVVLTMNKLLKKTGGSLRICGVNYIIDDLFTALNIYQIIPCFKTVAEAVADWNTGS